ncbi:hypothetical protein [Bosea sp. CS1GBMeth4]|uniref:hypothetical protein n=1 Tax=Bosea sp. CS1GBMeth4 TaxID=1892849 RepID=UPI001648A762|nr:hypothetical protein [Bosea sp. CS1GBMeth4]
MSRRSRADLWGSIRLVDVPDSIGIPLFSVSNSNSLWVSETDGDFRITRFLLLPPDAPYRLVQQIPPGVTRRRMMIGEYAPVPFWVNGKLHHVNGNAYPEDVPDIATQSPEAAEVVDDVRRLLDDARNGRFKARLQRDEAERIIDAFPDVFEEVPVHSRYWVSRFRLAAAETVPGSRSEDLSQRLRSIGRQWLDRFASKTDTARFKGLVDAGHAGVFSDQEVKNLYFAYIIDLISRGKLAEAARGFLKDPGFASLFPAGIFEFHRFNQWPNTPFEYRRPKVLTDPLLAAVRDNHENPEMLAALRGVAYLYFGRKDAPLDFSQSLYPFRRAAQRELLEGRERMREIESLRTGWDLHRDEYLQQVDRVLSAFDRLKYLEGIDYANTRLVKEPKMKILGLESAYIEHLRSDEYYLTWRRERNEPEDWHDTWFKG